MGGEDYALSGAGLWPLLALLASAADDPAAAELAAAVGRPADGAQQEALEIIDILRGGQSTSAALGIWTRKGVPLDEQWAAPLPNGVIGPLTDQAALDRWADEQTGGLINKFPLEITQETLLVLASALTARVRWRTPFEGSPRVRGETWRPDDPGPADQQSLRRTTSKLSIAAVLDDVVTRVVVEGDGDVDVHLLLGTDQPPAEILGAGLRELSGQAQVRLAADTGDRGGPGLTVERLKSARPKDMLELSLPSFEIRTKHHLLANSDLFGLRLLTTSTSHLPRLSPIPLAISGGAQDVLARFFAEGFEAAAVTSFGMMTGVLEPHYDVTYVSVDFDRPFGFLAVHRPSRLAVVAGWVKSPFQAD